MGRIQDGGPFLTSADERELEKLLRELHLLPPAPSSSRNRNDSDSDEANPLLLIRAPVMTVTKWAAGAIGGLGITAGSALAAIGAWLGGLSPDERIAFIAAAAFLLATVAIAAAWVVVADIQARRALTQQKYVSRADISSEYLQLACSRPMLKPPGV